MRRLFPLLIVAVTMALILPRLLLSSGEEQAEDKKATAREPGQAPAIQGLSMRYHYLRKEDPTQREDYYRLGLAYETGSRYINFRGGVELRVFAPQVRAYWLGDDLRITKRGKIHLRMNHTEFQDWDTGINQMSAYYSYRRRWLRVAAGAGYVALLFEPGRSSNPLDFGSGTTETRFIYDLSLRPSFLNKRVELDLGLTNFDDYEFHGFDSTGYHLQPVFNINENTSVSFLYERRYAAAFISVPTLTRITWMASVEHRF